MLSHLHKQAFELVFNDQISAFRELLQRNVAFYTREKRSKPCNILIQS